MIKLIIFDWDDVFTLGSKEAYVYCYHKALERVGVNLDPDEEKKRVFARWGWPFEEVIKLLLDEHLEKVEEAARAYEQALLGNSFVSRLTLVPGSIELLERLNKKYKMAIVSGINPSLLLNKVMPRFNIPYVFSDIVSVYGIPKPEYARPHPYMAQEILKHLNMSPEETILVGDAASDMQLAKNAGLTPVTVLTGHLIKPEAEAMGVKYIIPDVTHLEEVLKQV